MGREAKVNLASQQAMAVSQHLAASRQPSMILDMMGRPVDIGGLYLLLSANGVQVRVTSIEPVVDLAKPAGLREVTFELKMTIPNFSQVRNLVILAPPQVSEPVTPPGDGEQKEPPPADPPPADPDKPLIQLTDADSQ